MIFFLILTVRGTFHNKDFKWKKNRGTKLISEKKKFCKPNLTKEQKQSPMTTSQQTIFLPCIYSVLVPKNPQKFRLRCLVQEFSFTDIFNDINHGYRAAILKKKNVATSVFNGCGYYSILLIKCIAIIIRCTEQCTLRLNRISLTFTEWN